LRPADNFSLTLKVYREAKGLSNRMFDSSTKKDNATWMVKGPMGKSLGVKRNGEHIAFAAGTGAITFMDLSAYIARFVLGEMDKEEASQIGEDFKFTYYVTYFNRD
jgi:NAD(P)H-flavin reductase